MMRPCLTKTLIIDAHLLGGGMPSIRPQNVSDGKNDTPSIRIPSLRGRGYFTKRIGRKSWLPLSTMFHRIQKKSVSIEPITSSAIRKESMRIETPTNGFKIPPRAEGGQSLKVRPLGMREQYQNGKSNGGKAKKSLVIGAVRLSQEPMQHWITSCRFVWGVRILPRISVYRAQNAINPRAAGN